MPEVKMEKWAEEMLEEHWHLRAEVAELLNFVRQPRPEIRVTGYHTWATTLSEKLLALHDRLFRHFRLEEQGGMMQELSERFPRSSATVDHLLEQHRTILGEVCQLMTESLRYGTGVSPDDPRLRRRVVKVLREVAQHEEAESELMQRMRYDDLGGFD